MNELQVESEIVKLIKQKEEVNRALIKLLKEMDAINKRNQTKVKKE